MADIDLKTETPDTTLPTTGFLFGADSQAAASPSVFTVQSVATTLLGSTTLTGATVTTSSPVIDAAQTWNDGAVTFTGLKFNADTGSNAGSAAASLLMDLQLEGTSRFKVSKAGTLTVGSGSATAGSQGISFSGSSLAGIYESSAQLFFTGNAANFAAQVFAASNINITNDTGNFRWGTSNDVILGRRAAANLRLGAADAAAPVAQTLSVQSVVAGTTNTAGANLTITGSQGTGTGAGGSIVFQVAPAGSSGDAQNALADVLTLTANSGLTLSNIQNTSTTNDSTILTLSSANRASAIVLSCPAGRNNSIVFNQTTTERGRIAYDINTNALTFNVNTADVWRINSSGHFLAVTDNTYDIGASGANRPRNVYVAGTYNSSAAVALNNGNMQVIGSASTAYVDANDFVFRNYAGNAAPGVVAFGGKTSSFPALKRSTTSLQAVLADDTGFTNIQGKLTTETAYTAGAPTATGYLVLYDSNGTAYKVAAEAL